jgi:hypothetical protein
VHELCLKKSVTYGTTPRKRVEAIPIPAQKSLNHVMLPATLQKPKTNREKSTYIKLYYPDSRKAYT